jgi:hypothetical protein
VAPLVVVSPVVGVVIVGPASTLMVKVFVETVTPLKSVTWTAMPLNVPVAEGVPEMVPFAVLKFKPPGSVPEKL